jgi:phasin family protein
MLLLNRRKEAGMTQAYEEFSRYGKNFADSSALSLASLSNGAQAIAAEATEYTRKSVEAGGSFMEALLSANSLEDAIDIQAGYFKQAYEAFVAESSRLGELYTDLTRDAYKPFESLIVTAG